MVGVGRAHSPYANRFRPREVVGRRSRPTACSSQRSGSTRSNETLATTSAPPTSRHSHRLPETRCDVLPRPNSAAQASGLAALSDNGADDMSPDAAKTSILDRRRLTRLHHWPVNRGMLCSRISDTYGGLRNLLLLARSCWTYVRPEFSATPTALGERVNPGAQAGSDTRTFDRAWDGTNASAVEEAHPIQAVGWTPVLRGWRWRFRRVRRPAPTPA
jgi:hypothetical protein